jgi:hypothetical protein
MACSSDDPAGWRRYLRWPLPLALIWLLAPVVGICIRLSLEPVGPHDYWWSLAMGKLIAASGDIPAANIFLYTLPVDTPFFNQPWLGQWWMYLAYDSLGHVGPILMRNLLAVLAWVGLVVLALRRCDEPRVVGGFALAIAIVSGPVFGVRTQMFAFIPYVVLVGVLFAVADGRLRRPWLLALVPLVALWANLHGTFMLAAVLTGLCGAAVVVERWLEHREVHMGELGWWAGGTLAVGLAGLANPRGVGIYAYVVDLAFASHVSETVTEWQPPDPFTPFGAIVLVVLGASLLVMAWRRHKVRLFEALLFAATAYLALGAVRQMFWWGAVMLMVVPRHVTGLLDLEPWWKGRTSAVQGIGHAAAALGLIVACLLSQPGLIGHSIGYQFTEGFARRSPPAQGLLSAANPTRLVADLAEHGYAGRIFHDQAVGGMLEFVLATEPAEQVAFVDQRMEMIPESIWGDYFTLSRAYGGWEELVDAYDIGTMMLAVEDQWRLIQRLQVDERWVLVAVDEGHLLFMRADADRELTRWRSGPSEITEAPR